jgi:hypothetical protein
MKHLNMELPHPLHGSMLLKNWIRIRNDLAETGYTEDLTSYTNASIFPTWIYQRGMISGK